MVSKCSDVATILNIPNNIFKEANQDIELNFCAPKNDLKPFLDLIDSDEVKFKLHEKKIVLNNQVKVHFDDPSVISTLNSDGPQKGIDYFATLNLDEDVMSAFDKIKKIGSRFGKIYFTVSEGKLYVETTDKNNAYSNGISFELENVEWENKPDHDLVIPFNYNLFVNLMNVINGDEFQIKLAYFEQSGGGLIYAFKGEEEKYFLMSVVE